MLKIIIEHPESAIALMTEQPADFACVMVVVYAKYAPFAVLSAPLAYPTPPALLLQQTLVFLNRDSTQAFKLIAAYM